MSTKIECRHCKNIHVFVLAAMILAVNSQEVNIIEVIKFGESKYQKNSITDKHLAHCMHTHTFEPVELL